MPKPYSFNEDILQELNNMGFNPDNLEEASTWLIDQNYQAENVAEWFFFSQFIFLIVALKPNFKGKTITVERDGFSRKVSYLAYVLILYSTAELIPDAICISLKGKEYYNSENWTLDSLLSSIFGNSVLSTAWREAEGFLFDYTKKKNIDKANNLKTMNAFSLLGILYKNNISISKFLKSNISHSVYISSSANRLKKCGDYWELVLLALYSPMTIPSIENSRKTLMLTQGNLPNATFVLYHYTLLWEAKKEKNGIKYAKLFFKKEIDSLFMMFSLCDREKVSDDHFGIYFVFSKLLSDSDFKETLVQLSMAIEFKKNEK